MVREYSATPRSLSAGVLPLHVETSTGTLDAQRRVEDWIVSHLDNSVSPADPSSPGATPDLSMFRKTGGPPSPTDPKGPNAKGWTRLKLNRRQGILVARLVDPTLVKESDLHDVADELNAVLDAWNHRIVLNFAAVERLSSQVVGTVLEAHRRCEGRDGGRLKLCGLRPDVVRVFELAGVAGRLAIEPDEAAALDGPWPESRFPRPLPVSILSALSGRPEPSRPSASHGSDAPLTLPVRSGPSRPSNSAAETQFSDSVVGHVKDARPAPDRSTTPVLGLDRPPLVRLIAETGRGQGQVVTVTRFPFRIGRAEICDLHCDHPTISRIHATLKVWGDRVHLRDLATTNGTQVNGHLLRGNEALIADGDRIEIGPLRFRVALGDGTAQVENLIDDWLLGDETGDDSTPTILAVEVGSETNGQVLKSELIQGVLVITPTLGELADEPTVEALRAALNELLECGRPTRVVVNLDLVATLSSRAIGLLLSHALRLERAGGALRISQAPARIRMILEQIRLTMLITLYPTVDDAVLAAWP